MENVGGNWLPSGIFAVLFVVNVFLKVLPRILPKKYVSPQESALLKEIKDLNRSANELSSPATYSKSAKMKRTAVAKEKELALLKEKQGTSKYGLLIFNAAIPRILKTVVHLVLLQQFWHITVANIPVSLIKPADYLLHIGKKDESGEFVATSATALETQFLSEPLCRSCALQHLRRMNRLSSTPSRSQPSFKWNNRQRRLMRGESWLHILMSHES